LPDKRPLYIGKAEDRLASRNLNTHFAIELLQGDRNEPAALRGAALVALRGQLYRRFDYQRAQSSGSLCQLE
jgi:hypothetical protein